MMTSRIAFWGTLFLGIFLSLPALSQTDHWSKKAETAVKLIETRASKNKPGIAYLISRHDKVVASGAVGMANLEWGIPLSAETLIRIGSLSKPITSIAVLKMVEENKLALDTPIRDYSPQLPPLMGKRTLRQLLSHQSGLADHAFDETLIPLIWQPMSTEQIIAFQKTKPETGPPGEKFEYVNFNYVLVAHVIEQVTGKTFVDFVNEDIFGHLGLTHSAYDEPARIVPHRAEFYELKGDQFAHAADIDMSHVSAAGAYLSSARDMHTWMTLLIQEKIIGKSLLKQAWTPSVVKDGTSVPYGLGFNISTFKGEKYVWHTGLTPGAQSAFGYAPESGVFIVVLSNVFYWPADTGDLVDELMTIMLAKA